MAQINENDLLVEDEIAAAFLDDTDFFASANAGLDTPTPEAPKAPVVEEKAPEAPEEEWQEADEGFPGQLAVDLYETADKLVVKARTAGVDKKDLDVSISDDMLTISGTLSSGDEEDATQFYMQECYWGEFTRTIALPVAIKEDEVEAVLKDGVLTISFNKVKTQLPTRIPVIS